MTMQKNLTENIGWKSLKQLFDAMNESLEYCVLRNTEDITKNFSPEIHGDIDILVKEQAEAVCIMQAIKVHKESYRACYKVRVADNDVFFDIRYVGDNYYPKKWEKDMLKSAIRTKQDNLEFNILSPIHQYYTLLYHVYLQKQHVATDYPEKLRKYAALAELQYKNDTAIVMKQLRDYMVENRYSYELPCDLAVGINWSNLKCLNNYYAILFKEKTDFRRNILRIRLLTGKIVRRVKRIAVGR